MAQAESQTRIIPVTLDRSSPVPLYFQLAQAIEQAIDSGHFQVGDKVENEMALAKRLRLARPTIAQGIRILVDKGLLARKRGVGTVVMPRHLQRNVALTSLHEDLQAGGKTPETLVLDYDVVDLGEAFGDRLGLPATTRVVRMKRLRSVDGAPLAILTNYVPTDLAPSREDLERLGLYESMRARGADIGIARQDIGARLAAKDEAELLEVDRPAAVLTMDRHVTDQSGNLTEFGHHVYNADLYHFSTTLRD